MTTLLDVVFADERGFAALAFGHDGYYDENGKYDHRTWSEARYRWPAQRDELLRQLAQLAGAGERVDVYWCPALRTIDERRKHSAVDRLHFLWADLDGATTDEPLLNKLDPIAVASGTDGHRHLYVPLDRPVTPAQHRRLNRALAARIGGDHKWSNEALLRLPGTLNHKSDPPTPVEQLPGGGRVWNVDEIAALLDVDLTAPEQQPHTAAHTAQEAAPAELPYLVRARLDAPVTDRSTAHHALVGACRSSGLSLGQAIGVVAGYEPSVEKYGDRLPFEVERCWEKVDPPRPVATPLRVVGDDEHAPSAPVAAPARRLRIVRASAVVPKAARWLWQTGEYGRIPLGEVSVLAGRGNVGKSPFALWCAARLTRGELPGELFGNPVDVLIYASEDSHEHTTVPRLTAAGADLDRVHLLNGTETDEDPEMPLVWARDIDLIREAIEQTGARLLVIDPLIDVHRGGANTDRTDDVRAGLRPLVALAHRTGTAITGIAHFNKQRTGDVATLLSGSHGLRDTVRAVLAFVERPDGERVLGQDKNNLGRAGDDVPRLTYDMASVDVPIDGAPVSQPVFTITGTTDDTLSDVLLGGAADRADLPDDTAWLFELVAAGHPLPLHAKKCADEAESRGLKWDTVSRKARRSGLLVSRQERGAVANWVWTLTDDGARRAGKTPTPTEVDGA
ncbi:AAA family ATPase [Pseudonocardia hydrocarbonoxydans]|uniref:Uncharacterized protein n=1 Tax=Pseudonocardia hydrocarbonoxydans TaxID=76726 RepID=A0A4Y3WTF7_9PSEU|nr:AAA family ATPase [Pseudonocardia hydrocarbonoxydans]GEC22133.1 hypothetical protein PHY01_44160 [Pseudonocardia hydrocarbonoxydans]